MNEVFMICPYCGIRTRLYKGECLNCGTVLTRYTETIICEVDDIEIKE